MSVGEFIVSGEKEPLVALGMTGASFESAQKAGITRIEADTDAMEYIAQRIGYTALPSLVLIARDTSSERSRMGHWDALLPKHQGHPTTDRFFSANHLVEAERPASGNRKFFVEAARDIVAPALTEISVPSWENDTTHAGDFVVGLLLGQRPLNLAPQPSLRRMAKKPPLDIAESLLGAPKRLVMSVISDQRTVNAIHAVRADHTMPKPFIITRQPKNNRPELEEEPSV